LRCAILTDLQQPTDRPCDVATWAFAFGFERGVGSITTVSKIWRRSRVPARTSSWEADINLAGSRSFRALIAVRLLCRRNVDSLTTRLAYEAARHLRRCGSARPRGAPVRG
jgi:hypothetical protein